MGRWQGKGRPADGDVNMVWIDHVEGSWPADDLRRAFVMGAQWWEYRKTKATMWREDINLAEDRAEEVFPDGKLPPGTRKG